MRVLCRIDPNLPRDFFKQLQSLGVLRSASRLICKSRWLRRSSIRCWRFSEIMKVERKIASSDTTNVKKLNG